MARHDDDDDSSQNFRDADKVLIRFFVKWHISLNVSQTIFIEEQ